MDSRPRIDFETVAGTIGSLSGDERRVLAIAASLADLAPVDLGELLPGLERRSLSLVLAAISHAGGSHEHTEQLPERTGSGEEIVTPWGVSIESGPLYPWPDDEQVQTL